MHVVAGLKWSITQMGIFFAVLSGIMIIIQCPVLRKVLQKFSEEKLVIIGSVILGSNFILFYLYQIILSYFVGLQFCLQLVMVLCGHLLCLYSHSVQELFIKEQYKVWQVVMVT